MTSDQLRRITAWLRNRGPESDCRCGSDEWAPEEITGGATPDGRARPRMVVLLCRHCSFVKLASARVVGV